MKNQLTAILLLALITFSCKDQNKESNINLENQEPKTITTASCTDTTRVNSSEDNLSINVLNENKKALADFFTKKAKKPQLFLIDNNKDTTIVCLEKTRIKIKANSFISSKSNREVSNKIMVSVKEYYKISDIVLGKLSTTSDGNLLETGGMLYISATSNQDKCNLKKGATIEIEFPRTVEKQRMQLYTGNWSNNVINWKVQDNTTDLNQIFSKVDQQPVFPGGVDKMHQFISRNIKIPDDNVSGKIYATFIIDKEGNATNVRIVRGLSKKIDDEVIRVLKSLPKFSPGKINGIAVNVSYNIPIEIYPMEEIGSGAVSGQERMSKKQFERKYNNDEKLQQSGIANISYYLFSSNNLGFINCDRLWKDDKSPEIDYVLNFENNSQTSVYIVFHRFKSVVNNWSEENTISFKNIPSGENITIFAFKYFESKPFLAVKESKTSKQGENNLVFKPVTVEILKNEMKKLDRFN